MAKSETRIWYRIALACPNGRPALVAASGEHLGAAIAAAQGHVVGSWPIAAELANSDDIPLGESVGKGTVVDLGAAEVGPDFRWPLGVIPQIGWAVAGARIGWLERPDPELFVVEAQVDADHLNDVFFGLIERLPSADNLEVRVLDHFEDVGVTDVWLTSRVNARKIIHFLDDHDIEVIGNGHLELSVYVRAHRATLRLTEHKTVVWLAEGRALEADVVRWFGELGVPRVDALVAVYDHPHLHYRPANSRDRKKFGAELYRQRLRRVDALGSSSSA
jgi:hypothetical protein